MSRQPRGRPRGAVLFTTPGGQACRASVRSPPCSTCDPRYAPGSSPARAAGDAARTPTRRCRPATPAGPAGIARSRPSSARPRRSENVRLADGRRPRRDRFGRDIGEVRATPPCLIGKSVQSPAAHTRSTPRTWPYSSTGRNPPPSRGRPPRSGPRSAGSATIRSNSSSRPPGWIMHRSAARHLAPGRPDHLDPPVAEQRRQRAARHRAEQVQRDAFGRDEGDLEVGLHVPGPLGRHQRQLVGGQRPRGR